MTFTCSDLENVYLLLWQQNTSDVFQKLISIFGPNKWRNVLTTTTNTIIYFVVLSLKIPCGMRARGFEKALATVGNIKNYC